MSSRFLVFRPGRVFWIGTLAILILLVPVLSFATLFLVSHNHAAHAQRAASSSDWSTYLDDSGHHAYNTAETTLNAQTASQLKIHWQNQSSAAASSEPIVANGLVYWGSFDGYEHASDPATGNDVWKTYLGQTSSCFRHMTLGVISSATITQVTINNVATTVDIVGGGDAQVYALDANTGNILWHTLLDTQTGDFVYASPAVFNGNVYIGLSSTDDCPDIQGKFFQLDAASGTILNTFDVVPNGCLGGAVWGSASIDTVNQTLYFATGNNSITCPHREPYAVALVELSTTNLAFVSSWKVPYAQQTGDGDFGSTPTLFEGTSKGILYHMVGLINKNGYYYTFDRTNIAAGPLWQEQLAIPGNSPEAGKGSIASSAVNGSSLFIATGAATVNGKSCGGSLQSVNQSNGTINWRICLAAAVLAPIIAVPGLIVVGIGNTMKVFNAAKGQALFTYQDANPNSLFWGAATISNGILYESNLDGTLYAFGV